MGFIREGRLKVVSFNQLYENQKESESGNTDCHLDDSEHLRQKYLIQRKSVENFVHNSMSPLSAISGYLELLELALHADLEVEKLQMYRDKIEKGVNEIGFILEQMQELISRDDSVEMDLNAEWVIEEVISKLHNSTRFKEQVLSVVGKGRNVYLTADPFLLKIALYNVLMVSARFADQDEPIEISIRNVEDAAEILIRFHSESLQDHTLEYFRYMLENGKNDNALRKSDELKILTSLLYMRKMNGILELERKELFLFEFRLKLNSPS